MTIKNEAIKVFDHYWEHACSRKSFLFQMKKPDLEFLPVSKLKKIAGQADSMRNVVSLNEYFLEEYPEDMLHNTIPHELSHIIARKMYPKMRQSHGPEFRYVMSNIFDLSPTRCHQYDIEPLRVAGVVRKQKVIKRYHYSCSCREVINLSSIRHNKIVKGKQTYICLKCKGPIVRVI